MPDITKEEIDALCEKVRELKAQLSPRQRDLLDAILKIAWEVADPDKSLKEGFDGCFEPHQAAMILGYGLGGNIIKPHIIKP